LTYQRIAFFLCADLGDSNSKGITTRNDHHQNLRQSGLQGRYSARKMG